MRKSLASASLILALLACRSDKPEDQVRKAFEGCRTAVEAGDAIAATDPLDSTFKGPEGMDKATARLFLLGTLRREKVGITVLHNEVTVRGRDALQEVDLVFTGRQGGLLPQDASHRQYLLRWRQAGTQWRLLEVQSL